MSPHDPFLLVEPLPFRLENIRWDKCTQICNVFGSSVVMEMILGDFEPSCDVFSLSEMLKTD